MSETELYAAVAFQRTEEFQEGLFKEAKRDIHDLIERKIKAGKTWLSVSLPKSCPYTQLLTNYYRDLGYTVSVSLHGKSMKISWGTKPTAIQTSADKNKQLTRIGSPSNITNIASFLLGGGMFGVIVGWIVWLCQI